LWAEITQIVLIMAIMAITTIDATTMATHFTTRIP
jgi:hypothetical protein